jgi:hypothetical protein
MHRYKPGERVPFSGYYVMVYRNGKQTGDDRYCFAGDPFPPSRFKKVRFQLSMKVDKPRKKPSKVVPRGLCRVCRAKLG